MPLFSIHEHELKENVDHVEYEHAIATVLQKIKIPGLLSAYQLKGFKGVRKDRYSILWVFENKNTIVENFGTIEHPKWPEDWLYYENEVLAKFITVHPDKIHFTCYEVFNEIHY